MRTSLYGLLGGRLRLDTRTAGALDLSARGGQAASGERARWLEGEAGWELARATRQLAWGLRTEAFGLSYARPFDFHAFGATLQPSLSAAAGDAVVSARGDLRRGEWKLLPLLPGDSAASGVLSLTGGSLTVSRLMGGAWLEAGTEVYRGAFDGWFAGAVASAFAVRRDLALGATLRAWSTPRGAELGVVGRASLRVGDAGWLRFEVGRTATDPLYGTPGSLGASAGFSLRISGNRVARARSPVVEVGDAASGGLRVRFRLHRPLAHAVAVAGDFTAWAPRTMARQGDDWVLEMTIPAGVHHFSFLLDGRTWFVPADAPGIAQDEWGRENATLVLET